MQTNRPKAPTHNRIKPKRNKMTAELERYHNWVREKGCVICQRPASAHHQPFGRGAKDHRYVVSLCWDHHQGDKGIHDLGHADLFYDMYGVDLTQMALDNWEAWQCLSI